MKKKILLLCLILALLSMASAGTYAYYNKSVIATNTVTTGSVDMIIHETGADGAPYPTDPVVILPGDVVSKVVKVENSGNQPMYLRVKLTPGVNDPALSAQDCIRMDINHTDWTARDGYYYYNKTLNPGEITPALFTEVTFVGEKVTNAYLGKLFSLDVAAFAVQSVHNGETPLEAEGWPEA